MRISDVVAIPVNLPYDAPTRWAFGYRDGVSQMIIKFTTDEEIAGIGELISHAFMPSLIESIKSEVIDLDPLECSCIRT